MTRFLALLIGLSVIATAAPARADISSRRGMFCSEAQLENEKSSVTGMPREWQVRSHEVILDGTIESYRSSPNRPGLTILRVNKVWKGDAAPRVALLVWRPSPYLPEWPVHNMPPPDCSNPVRAGVQVRIGATIADDTGHWTSIYPEIDENTNVLGGTRSWNLIYLPLHDPELERLLTAYQVKTDALRQAAATGDQQAKLAYATHLLNNNERRRAYEVAGALRRDGVKLSLSDPLLLDPEEKDWSDLKRIRGACYSDHGNFDTASFDRADLSECAFRYSSFRGASFRGTDLSGSYFQDSDLTGAKYDCATKLPDDLDPVAAGMINVQGACPRPVPQ